MEYTGNHRLSKFQEKSRYLKNSRKIIKKDLKPTVPTIF